MSSPIDPLTGPHYALEGKVVTMDDTFRVLERGVVYVDAGQIVAVEPTAAPAPPGFAGAPLIRTGGTIYPGLVELHNHLSYNALSLWNVPRQFSNRAQWGRHADYRKLISGPMGVLGRTHGYVEAIVRYVECKCLLAGVTTSQGIALYSNGGIQKYYRGVIRNVEDTGDDALPQALTRISDVEAQAVDKFLARLQQCTCLLLHLSEGVDEKAREHFQALHLGDGQWAITDALCGIHSAGLLAEDFQLMQQLGGSMVWSPLSNLLLYGATANIAAARASGILIGLGSDWSPTGSKNLLGELKVARLVSQALGGLFTDREIVAMATRNAAKILKWDEALGSLEPGKRADLFVVTGRQGDPYDRLLRSRESTISLVVVNGMPRCGQVRLMETFGVGTEPWTVGRAQRILNLEHETGDPIVGALTLRQATDRLQEGLCKLPELARALEDPVAAMLNMGTDTGETRWFLVLDHTELVGETQRPHLPLGVAGEPTGLLTEAAAAVPLSQLLEPLELDPLTVVDNRSFLDRVGQQANLPDFVKEGLPELY